MRVLTNQRTKRLFAQMVLCMGGFLALSAAVWGPAAAVCALCMGAATLLCCYRYFKDQDRVMEAAVKRIQAFVSGERDARIDCDEEGELYRLFHEVNSLAAILNSKAENEGRARCSLQNTISDISHQLKTPLAALNIYNGIMQTEAEAGGLSTIREFTDLSEQELDRIETLVQNLLKIAKFDAGSIVMEKHRENSRAVRLSEAGQGVSGRAAWRIESEGAA